VIISTTAPLRRCTSRTLIRGNISLCRCELCTATGEILAHSRADESKSSRNLPRRNSHSRTPTV